jgi:hypothetical protein
MPRVIYRKIVEVTVDDTEWAKLDDAGLDELTAFASTAIECFLDRLDINGRPRFHVTYKD